MFLTKGVGRAAAEESVADGMLSNRVPVLAAAGVKCCLLCVHIDAIEELWAVTAVTNLCDAKRTSDLMMNFRAAAP